VGLTVFIHFTTVQCVAPTGCLDGFVLLQRYRSAAHQ
jgi:hypothetical protein